MDAKRTSYPMVRKVTYGTQSETVKRAEDASFTEPECNEPT
jgi:hypothetical protein